MVCVSGGNDGGYFVGGLADGCRDLWIDACEVYVED